MLLLSPFSKEYGPFIRANLDNSFSKRRYGPCLVEPCPVDTKVKSLQTYTQTTDKKRQVELCSFFVSIAKRLLWQASGLCVLIRSTVTNHTVA